MAKKKLDYETWRRTESKMDAKDHIITKLAKVTLSKKKKDKKNVQG